MPKEIQITVNPDGTTKTDFSGFTGPSCLDAASRLRCKLQNSVSYFWYCSVSYFLNCSAWIAAMDDKEQVKKYDTEFCNLHPDGFKQTRTWLRERM